MANLKRTREDILTSAIDLVHRQGLQSTGLKELFAATQASSGSFYDQPDRLKRGFTSIRTLIKDALI
jgi:hypothetical protein